MIDTREIFFKRVNICRDDISDMDEISCLRTITKYSRCFVIFDLIQKYRDHSCLAESVLTRSVHIGIAEHRGAKSILTVIKFEKELDSSLRDTIWCLGMGFMGFAVGWSISAKHGATCGREYHARTITTAHRFENIHGTQNIYFDIVRRILDRFTDIYLGCEMIDYLWLDLCEELVNPLSISYICFSEMHSSIRVMMGDVGSLTSAEIIDDEDFVTSLNTSINYVRANESCSSCYKYFHTWNDSEKKLKTRKKLSQILGEKD